MNLFLESALSSAVNVDNGHVSSTKNGLHDFLKAPQTWKNPQLREVDIPLPSSTFRSVSLLKFPNIAVEQST